VRKLIANRVTEQDVRDYLSSQGYDGKSARFDYLDLVAIARPGWIQVFKFCVHVFDDSGARHRFLGVVRDDERSSTKIHLSYTAEQQELVVERWAAGLITAGRKPLERSQKLLMFVFAGVLAIALLGAVLSANMAGP
jgi:hypothetical protein